MIVKDADPVGGGFDFGGTADPAHVDLEEGDELEAPATLEDGFDAPPDPETTADDEPWYLATWFQDILSRVQTLTVARWFDPAPVVPDMRAYEAEQPDTAPADTHEQVRDEALREETLHTETHAAEEKRQEVRLADLYVVRDV